MNIAVIGAGASGLAASYFAAERHNVTLFEKQHKPGKKILASGNGKCNITNTGIDSKRYHSTDSLFIDTILSRFGLSETEDFFNHLGIYLCEENFGRLFPCSFQSSSVVDILLDACRSRRVNLLVNREVTSIVQKGSLFTVTTAGHESLEFHKVILASGSRAYSPLGGNDTGYLLAESLGHSVTSLFPSIVPVTIKGKPFHRMKGIRWNSSMSVLYDNSVVASTTGEVQFTDYGLSGPGTLDLSRYINKGVTENISVTVEIDLFPHMDQDSLSALTASVLSEENRSVVLALRGLLKNEMPQFLLKTIGLSNDILCGQLKSKERESLIHAMKHLTFHPGEPRSFNEAVVAAGGVCVEEVDCHTMESKILPGLYLTGELLDVDGDSGGFNLQFAWSSGALAGKNV